MRQHLAIYGNVQIIRADCYACGRYALVIDGALQCCGRLVETEPVEIKRMSQPEARRRTPNAAHKKEILEAQNYRCLYCDISLDGYAVYRSQLRRVQLTWDHMAPYAYTLNNHPENFAATCQFCNAWKSSLIFRTVDEVRIYVEAKWRAEGNSTSHLQEQRLQDAVPEETRLAEVLQPAVPVPKLEPKPPPRKGRKKRRRRKRRRLKRVVVKVVKKRICKQCGVEWPHPRWKGQAEGIICWRRRYSTAI